MGLDLDPSGRLLVADTYANRVLRLDLPRTRNRLGVGGTVAPTLMLSLGERRRASPRFTPGRRAHVHGDAGRRRALDRGRRDAGGERPEPERVRPSGQRRVHARSSHYASRAPPLPATVKTWTGPASHDPVTIALSQAIGANEPLRTGTYAKTLTFSLSTTQP